MEIVLGILFGIFSLVIVYFYIAILWKKHYEKLSEVTQYQIVDLGHNISIAGPKGAGKTTTACGFAHMLTNYIIALCNNRMNDIRIKLEHVDFNLVQAYFIECLENLELLDNPPYKSWYYDEAISKTVSFIIQDSKFQYYYTNFINVENKKELLEDYLLYFLILNFRHHYVVSTASFFNRVSLENALLYDPSSLELRSVITKRNFDQDFCNIIFNDEVSIGRGNVYSNDKNIKLSGTVYFKILERNAFLGTHYTISMKQSAMNEVKQDRDLCDCNLEIFDRKDDLSTFKSLQKFLNVVYSCSLIPIKMWYFITSIFRKQSYIELLNFKLNSPCILRKFEKFIYQINKLLISTGYIRVRMKLYLRPEDVGSENEKKYKPYVFYIPIQWCYGVVDTYEYRPVSEYYMSSSSDTAVLRKVSHKNKIDRVDRYLDLIYQKGA